MKLNERLYDVLEYLPNDDLDAELEKNTPFEVQEIGEHKVELFYMDTYPDVIEEFTKRDKFAVWASKDGKNYRLCLLKEYYEKLSPLYTKENNQKWLEFWDNCEDTQKKFSRYIILPITTVVILLFLFLANWNRMFVNAQMPNSLNLAFTLGIPLVYLVVVMTLRKNVYNKILNYQQEATKAIKNNLGDKKFEKLLKEQRTFKDEYFERKEEESDFEEENKAIETKEDKDASEETKETETK